MKKYTIYLLLLATIFGCHAKKEASHNETQKEHSTGSTADAMNGVCRAVINSRDNHFSYIVYSKNDVQEEKHWGQIVRISDILHQVLIVTNSAHHGDYTFDRLWIKNLNTKKYYYPHLNRSRTFMFESEYGMYCVPFKYHLEQDVNLRYNNGNPYCFRNEKTLEETSHISYSYLVGDGSNVIKNWNYCFCDTKDCRFKNKVAFSCELEKVVHRADIAAIFENIITLNFSSTSTSCYDEFNRNTTIINFDSIKYKSTLNSFNDEPYTPTVLFAGGTKHRRQLASLDYHEGHEGERIEIENPNEEQQMLLEAIDRAPDGCGTFDWNTVELVFQDGRRYAVANGDYESITGIVWLRPDEDLNRDALDNKADKPIVIDEGYEAPPPLPNCHYFTKEAMKERWEDEKERCQICQAKYPNPNGTGVNACEEYDISFEEYFENEAGGIIW